MSLTAESAAAATGVAAQIECASSTDPAYTELTPYAAACEAAALLRKAATAAAAHGPESAGGYLSVAEGWRHLAATLNGGARPIMPPKPVEADGGR